MIKKILIAFLLCLTSMNSYAAPARRGINLNSERTLNVLKKYFPNEFDREAVITFIYYTAHEHNKAVEGHGLYMEDFSSLCHEIAGWDLNTETGKKKCKQFVYELKASKIDKYYYVCELPYPDIPAKNQWCEDEIFKGTQVTALQAVGLAKEYAKIYFEDDIECITRLGGFNDYVTCRSKTLPKWYEFVFDDIVESVDKTIQNSLEESLCKLHGYGYQEPISSMDAHGGIKTTMSYCKDVYDAHSCDKISKSATRFGWITEIRLGNCGFFQETPIYSKDSLMTAYNIKNDVFYSSSIQIQGSEDLHSMLRTYVANTIAPEVLTSFECNYNPVQIGSIRGNSDTDDVLTCQANGNRIDFVFDDLSELSNLQDKAGKEALSCTIVGGTFTGQRCANLNKEQCASVAKSPVCQDCNVYWDEKNGICTLGNASVSEKLKKGATVSLIVGGAVVSVVITVGTAGAGGVTLSTAAILLVETVGAGIEIASQVKINGIADDFFVQSSNCNSENCAADLINEYLIKLARLGRDLTDAEYEAVDQEMARLLTLIPTDSEWWYKSLKLNDGSSLLESADDGKWTSEQVWRAIGIAMQFTSVVSSISKWIISKAGDLTKTLDRTSRILLKNSKIAQQNIVKLADLDAVDKEWYRLWQEYAPKNQTFDQFKAMADGDLAKMKEMSKGWLSRSERLQYQASIEEAAADLRAKYKNWDELMIKYNLDALPQDPKELELLYEQYPDLKQATEIMEAAQTKLADAQAFASNTSNTSYSTYNPEFNRFVKEYDANVKSLEEFIQEEHLRYINEHPTEDPSKFFETPEYKDLSSRLDNLTRDYQYMVAEQFPLENLGNVVSERADQFAEIIAKHPEIQSKLDATTWQHMTDQERATTVQQILDEYATTTNTAHTKVELDYDTEWGGYYSSRTKKIALNPNAQLRTPEGAIEVAAHEHGHLIDNTLPNEGALGEQYKYYTDKNYSNLKEEGYRVALTEQSSYKIGPETSKRVTGAKYYGEEHDLVAAENKLKEAAQYNITSNTIHTTVPVGTTVYGIGYGIMTEIQENKENK